MYTRDRRFAALCVFFLILLLPRCGRCDLLFLKNGNTLNGKVEKIEGGYRVEQDGIVTIVEDDKVERWVKTASPEEEYCDLCRFARQDDFDTQLALADWCRNNHLRKRAEYHYNVAVSLRPDDSRARRGAGYVRHEGMWIRNDEYMEIKGYVKYGKSWMPAAEAEKLKIKDEQEKKRENIYASSRQIIRTAALRRTAPDLDDIAKNLAEQGPLVLGALKDADDDCLAGAREIALRAYWRMGGKEPRELLLDRLQREPDKELVLLAACALSWREDRLKTLSDELSLAVNGKSKLSRRRAMLGLRAMADKRAIDALIEQTEYCPVPDSAPAADAATEQDKDNKDAKDKTDAAAGKDSKAVGKKREVVYDGEKFVEGETRQAEKYYPAHEALLYLTRQLLPHDKEAWQRWWGYKRDSFEFEPIKDAPAPPEELKENPPADPTDQNAVAATADSAPANAAAKSSASVKPASPETTVTLAPVENRK